MSAKISTEADAGRRNRHYERRTPARQSPANEVVTDSAVAKPANEVITDFGAGKPASEVIPDPDLPKPANEVITDSRLLPRLQNQPTRWTTDSGAQAEPAPAALPHALPPPVPVSRIAS